MWSLALVWLTSYSHVKVLPGNFILSHLIIHAMTTESVYRLNMPIA